MRSILFGLFASLACLAETQHVTYSYDDAGHLTQVDYGNGQTITYSYDKAGNLLSNTVTSAAASQNRKAATAGKRKSARTAVQSAAKEK